MLVLGISAFYHDSAAAIVRDGEIIAAAQEERFSRRKGDADFPAGAIRYCLEEADVTLDEVDFVGFYDKPLLTFDRLIETYVAFAPRGFKSFAHAIPIWLKEKLLQKRTLARGFEEIGGGDFDAGKLKFGFHHHSHAASAFYPSPFESAAILVMDGVGEWATTSLGRGSGATIELFREIRFPHSLGMLYSAFTYYLGFAVNDGEYKVMGLAPYGEPRYAGRILDNLIDLKADGSFRLDMRYFDYCTGLAMTNGRFADLFEGPRRTDAEPLTQRHMDIARSVQAVTEEAILRICRTLAKETGERNLCLAGGVALNCVANGKILRDGAFDNIWIQPAAGDSGGALGVALTIDHCLGQTPRRAGGNGDGMKGAYLGPAFDRAEIGAVIARFDAVFDELGDDALFAAVVDALAGEKVVGWFQGRMEFGPRALGNRSILADPRSRNMQRILNMKIKYRESFRPFAPAVLEEKAADYFELETESPYMLLVADMRDSHRRPLSAEEGALFGLDKLNAVRSDVPAITHVDYSARVQTVTRESNPRFHRLLEEFETRTGVPVLVNTSFNIRDEPIVCTPEEAFRCFMGTEMDMLVLGNTVLRKEDQW